MHQNFSTIAHGNDFFYDLKFRCLGLRGHHALFRKTANDELQNDAWKHMDQIVPSIIFNMKNGEQIQSQRSTTPTTIASPEDVVIETIKEDSSSLAAVILRDLFCRTHSNNNISICIQPILIELDKYGKWIPCDFPKYIFSQIMNSIKYHNSYVIIDLLLNHLEKYLDIGDRTNIKTSIMNVIHDSLVFAAPNTGVVGSTMLGGITRLLECLKKSFQIASRRSRTPSKDQNEQQFQTAVINVIVPEDFAEKLPDFQMMEIIKCIVTSLPIYHQSIEEKTKDSSDTNLKFQLLLLKTIQNIILKKRFRHSTLTNSSKVTTTYNSEQSNEITSTLTTFPHQLFDPLIKMMSASESEVRLIVLEILQLLVDRRYYADKLCKIRILKDISQLGLPTETRKSRLFDIAFMKKFGHQFCSQLYKCILIENNTKKNFYAIYCLMNLVTIEANDQDVLVDVIHFCLEVQSAIIKMMDEDQQKLSKINYHCIHALIAAYFNLISKLYDITSFSRYVDQVS
ncbi:unnamed protein product [Rotaria sordida]|uniref:Uncharacterized protein n=1 Tax=Rotaria sordida TaxID=392033 RepID=A0A815FVE5_9BILA|nr:unnamed protein product [Rotaria sordida]